MAQAKPTLEVDLDVRSDVLYVSKGAPQKDFLDKESGALYFRSSDADESPSGVTVVGFSGKWNASKEGITKPISQHLGYPESEVEKQIASAMASLNLG